MSESTNKEGTVKLILEHGTNVDLMYGQGNGTGYWTKPIDPERMEVKVRHLADAAKALRTWVDRNGLGCGNITQECGTVYEGRDDLGWVAVARVSYNGRVWTPHAWTDPDRKEIKVAA